MCCLLVILRVLLKYCTCIPAGIGRDRRVRRKARRRRHGEGDDDAGTEDQRLLQQGRGIWGLIIMLLCVLQDLVNDNSFILHLIKHFTN